MKTKICLNCNKEFTYLKGNNKFCSKECQYKNYYNKNKKDIIRRSQEWGNKNPEKRKEINKLAVKKFITEKPERFKELMKDNYKKNKNRWNCRALTYYLIINNKIPFKKYCKVCASNKDLEIHHEIYPISSKEIKKAIAEEKIYFLCKKHHNLTKILNKNK